MPGIYPFPLLKKRTVYSSLFILLFMETVKPGWIRSIAVHNTIPEICGSLTHLSGWRSHQVKNYLITTFGERLASRNPKSGNRILWIKKPRDYIRSAILRFFDWEICCNYLLSPSSSPSWIELLASPLLGMLKSKFFWRELVLSLCFVQP